MKNNQKNRSTAFIRHHNRRIVNKKKRIYFEYWQNDTLYHAEGKFRKGKIHCSCWCCSVKSSIWGFKEHEKAKWESMKQDIDEYINKQNL